MDDTHSKIVNSLVQMSKEILTETNNLYLIASIIGREINVMRLANATAADLASEAANIYHEYKPDAMVVIYDMYVSTIPIEVKDPKEMIDISKEIQKAEQSKPVKREAICLTYKSNDDCFSQILPYRRAESFRICSWDEPIKVMGVVCSITDKLYVKEQSLH